jgi:hypothetical protein
MSDGSPLAERGRSPVTLVSRASHIPHCTTLFFTRLGFLNYRGQFGGCWRPEGTYRRCRPSCILSPNKVRQHETAREQAVSSASAPFSRPRRHCSQRAWLAFSLGGLAWRICSTRNPPPPPRPPGCQHLHHLHPHTTAAVSSTIACPQP